MLISTHTTSNSQQKSKGHEKYFNPNKRQDQTWLVIFVQETGDHVLSRYVITQSEVFIEKVSHTADQKIPPTLHGT